MCAVSVLAPEGVAFQYTVAPRLPDAIRSALSTAVIDIRNGSCTAAVYLGRQVRVHDIAKDPFWEQKRQPAMDSLLRSACVHADQGVDGQGARPRSACSARKLGCPLRASRKRWRTPRSSRASPSNVVSAKKRCARAKP